MSDVIAKNLIVTSRELLEAGKTGGLVIFEDRPNYWDAWGMSLVPVGHAGIYDDFVIDVEVHHLEKATPLKFTNISVVAGGPLRASLRSVVKYGKSTITTTVSLRSSDGVIIIDLSGLDIIGCCTW